MMLFSLMLLAADVLGGTFVVSAIPKLFAPRRTGREVENYRILRGKAAAVYGWMLGPVQLVAGLSLLSGIQARWGAVVILLLLITFMVAVAVAMYRRQNLTCTCFGLLYRERVGWATQSRDAILVTAALAVALGGGTPSVVTLLSQGSLLGFAAAVWSLLVLATAIALGWVAATGWPGWLVRRRNRDATTAVQAPGSA